MRFQWFTLCVVIALCERPPSEVCLWISAQGSVEEPMNFSGIHKRSIEWTNRMHADNRSFLHSDVIGKYEGAEAVLEYVSLISPTSIFKESILQIVPQEGSGMVSEYVKTVLAPNGETFQHTMCSWVTMALMVETGNSSMMVDAFNYGTFTTKTTAMVRYEVSLTDQKIHGSWVYYPPDYMEVLSLMMATPEAAQFVCETIWKKCPEVWDFNSQYYTDLSSCIDHQISTSMYDQNGVWIGRSRSCRNVHVAFASTNSQHCAHLSTVPMADPNGAFKCQDEVDGGPSYHPVHELFSDAELEFAKQFGRQYGLYTGDIGGVVPVYDVASAFVPIANSTDANGAFGLCINVYSKAFVLLLWLTL